MSKKIKYQFLASVCLVVVIFALLGGSFAFFRAIFSKDSTLDTNITASQANYAVNISNFFDLFQNTKAEQYNDLAETSAVSARHTLVFQNDILLEEDLFVTADVHINLNSHKLLLNGHSITFQHGYYGSFVLENGSIDSSDGGQIVIDTPHASYVFSNVIYEEASVKTLSMDTVMTAYNVFYFVTSALVNDVDLRKERLTYEELLNKGNIALSDLVDVREHCLFGNHPESCVFVSKDLDLPYHYFSEDIQIRYESSDQTIIDNFGNLISLPQTFVNVDLTVIVSYKDAWSRSLTFPLHVVNTASKEMDSKLGETLIKTRLQNYWKESSEKVQYNGVELFDQYYFFTSAIDLPLESLDFDLTYSYKAKDYQKNETVTFSKAKEKVYRFEPNEKCFYLETTVTDQNGNASSFEVPMFCTYVMNEETVVRLMMNELYGGSIIYDSSLASKHLYSFAEMVGDAPSDLSEAVVQTLKEYRDLYHVTDIQYATTEEVVQHYEIQGNELVATLEGIKYKEKGIAVTAAFEDGTQLAIDLYVIYITGNGDTASGYWTYYNHYNETYVPTTLSQSFTMPFAYSMDGTNYSVPYTVYDVSYGYSLGSKELDGLATIVYYSADNVESGLEFKKPEGLLIRLVEGETTYVTLQYGGYSIDEGASWVPVADSKSLTTAFNAYLASSGKTLAELKRAQWEFAINVPGLTFDDIDLALLYNYSFIDQGKDTKWLPYVATVGEDKYYTSLTTSTFTMEGGLINAAGNVLNHVPDQQLFLWMYQNLTPGSTTISSPQGYYIQNDWLSKNVSLSVSGTLLENVTNWYGMQYLDATTLVNLSGITMTNEIMDYLCGTGGETENSLGMRSVEELYLDNCGLTSNMIDGKFANLKQLKLLSITENRINLFENALQEVASLDTVYLYHNTGTNVYWGSEGISNFQTYDDLKRRGVSVYYTMNNNDTPLLFENAEERNDYQRLKNLEYQSVLSKERNIEELYVGFRNLTANDLHISGNITAWGYEPGETGNTATYFYVRVTNGAATLTVKYYVDRY